MREIDAVGAVRVTSQSVDVDAFNASQRGEVYGDAPAMTAERFAQHVEHNSIDLSRSPRWTVDGILSGVALLGFRDQRAWVGGFGVVPNFRGHGLARRYMEEAFTVCRDAGSKTLELEVLVRNAPAIGLYKSSGFAIVDELIVWSRPARGANATSPAAYAFDEREIARVARTPSTCWQREPQTIALASTVERITIGDEAAPEAYAFIRRYVDRAALLDAGAVDKPSAELLLDALDAVVPEVALTLINEPAHGPLHQEFVVRNSWTQTTRQYRMRRPL